MALKTFGTNANNSLSAFVVGTDDITAAQVARLNHGIKGDPPGYSAPSGQAVQNMNIMLGFNEGAGTDQPAMFP